MRVIGNFSINNEDEFCRLGKLWGWDKKQTPTCFLDRVTYPMHVFIFEDRVVAFVCRKSGLYRINIGVDSQGNFYLNHSLADSHVMLEQLKSYIHVAALKDFVDVKVVDG